MGNVYHGSLKNNLKKIERRRSTHKENWVYATPSKLIATIFINIGHGDLSFYLEGNGSLEEPLILVERQPHTFDTIFGVSGSIYTLSDANFKTNKTSWDAEIVSDKDEIVLSEEKIDNILSKLNEYAMSGTLCLYRYPNRPDYIPLDNSDLIDQYIELYNEGFENSIKNLLRIYPEFKEIVSNKLEDK